MGETAVGSGIHGGILYKDDKTGKVTEKFYSASPQAGGLPDTGREDFLRKQNNQSRSSRSKSNIFIPVANQTNTTPVNLIQKQSVSSPSSPKRETTTQPSQFEQQAQKGMQSAIQTFYLRQSGIEKPTLIVSKAEPYKEYVSKYGYTSTPSYLIQKGRGYLSKEFESLKGQNPFQGETGEALSTGAEVGQYFIPYYGTGLAVLQAGELAVTPSRMKTLGIGGTTLTLFGGAVALSKGGTKLNKLFGFPKYETEVASKVLSQTESESGTLFKVSSVATTKEKKLIPINQREFLTTSESNINLQEQNPIFGFYGKMKGEQTQVLRSTLPRPLTMYGKSKPVSGNVKGYGFNLNEDITFGFLGTKAPKNKLGFGLFLTSQSDNSVYSYSRVNPVIGKPDKYKLSKSGVSRILGVMSQQPETTTDFITGLKLSGKSKPLTLISDTLAKTTAEASIPKSNSFLSKLPVTSGFTLIESPKMPGITGSKSLYYGLGSYEKTSETSAPTIGFGISNIGGNRINLGYSTPSINAIAPRIGISTRGNGNKNPIAESFGTATITNLNQPQRTPQRINEGLKQPSGFKQRPYYRNPPYLLTPTIPPANKIIPFPLGFDEDYSKRKKGSYLVEIRRKGRFKPIGRVSSLIGGYNLGMKATSQTLARSFRIKGSKGYLSLNPINNIFRKSKRNENILVQRGKFSLSSLGEKREIQSKRRRRYFL